MEQKAIVKEIEIQRITDDNPDLSYLEPANAQDKEHAEFCKERIESYNRGSWYFIGIRAMAIVHIPLGESFIVHKVYSGGLWGVESDSGDKYLKEIEDEEMYDLKLVLGKLGLTIPDDITIKHIVIPLT